MVPWVHYIPVDRDKLEEDLPAKVRWALANDDLAHRIANQSVHFAQAVLTHEWVWWCVHSRRSLAFFFRSMATSGGAPVDLWARFRTVEWTELAR